MKTPPAPFTPKAPPSFSIVGRWLFVLATVGLLQITAQGDDQITLLSETMHVGDQVQADMTNPKPDAKIFEQKFLWPDRIGFGDVFLIVKVSHMTPRDYPGFDKGFWQTEVFVNGKSVGILNKLLRGKEETAKIEQIVFPFEVTALKTGGNTLTIKPGAKDGGLDDLELHSVTISRSRPR